MTNNRIVVGNVTIVALSDGHLKVRARDSYPEVPDKAWDCGCNFVDGGPQLNSNLGSFLVLSGGQTIMVDTGIGPLPNEDSGSEWGLLPNDMNANNVNPDDVDAVFMTHLHFDHTGWNLVSQNGKLSPLFPKARYIANLLDWEFFRHEPEAKEKYYYNSEPVEPLMDLGLLELIDGVEYQLTDELTAIHTPGHTPGHMSILISSQGEKALILGDVAHNEKQVQETGWKVSADCDHDQARETRESIMDMLENENMIMAAGHFPAPGFGKVIMLEGKRYWQVV